MWQASKSRPRVCWSLLIHLQRVSVVRTLLQTFSCALDTGILDVGLGRTRSALVSSPRSDVSQFICFALMSDASCGRSETML